MSRKDQAQRRSGTCRVRTLRVLSSDAHLSTLRHFDNNLSVRVKNGPLIPCERRLPKRESWEFQELTFGTRFGNRDYDRPFQYILVTLRGSD